ncbi:MAG: hypothetical protein ABH952_11585 [Candidatus Omnitrophota bacterium]
MDISKIKTCSIKKRKSKVNIREFAKTSRKNASFRKFYRILPDILAARSFKSIVSWIIQARKNKKPVIFMLGAHTIKCGLNPIIIDLMKKGYITTVCLNGAGIIHDFELSLIGKTSEDVAAALDKGLFGMAEETAVFINEAIKKGAESGAGLGEAVGRMILNKRLPQRGLSILASAYKLKIPLTVHVALGTDIIHQHPSCNGAAIGKTSMADFYKLVEIVSGLTGGVLVNAGSAVILPEVFLKALNIARNLGRKVANFTTVNFDMIYHYRPAENIVSRPVACGGRGYYIIGHHEINIPLLYQALLEEGDIS